MILADTTVWIDHFRTRDSLLVNLMGALQLLIHPLVVGELAMGSLADRPLRFRLWGKMPTAEEQSHEHVLALVERRRLYSRGIGYMDASLLASALAMPGTLLWTRDRRLRDIAAEFGVAAKLDH